MAEQTAMQQLIQWMEDESEVIPFDQEYCYNKAKELLEMEKEQIAESWNDGNFLGRNGLILEEYSTGKQHYKEKYGTA